VSDVQTLFTDRAFTVPRDTLLLYSKNSATRSSIRYAAALRVPIMAQASLAVTAGADSWRSLTSSVSSSPIALTGSLANSSIERQPSHNAGGFVQSQVGLWESVFLTYGLRAEWNPNYGDDAQPNLAPRFGVAATREFGATTVKVRASYGRSTRPPEVGLKAAISQAQQAGSSAPTYLALYGPIDYTLANDELSPEFQKGGEGGLELYFGSRGSLVVTRYNQTVDLITRVQADSVQSLTQNPQFYNVLTPSGYGYLYQYQNLNVGSLRNQGWELQGTLVTGPLTTKGTYSWTKSRTIGVNPRYRSVLTDVQFTPGAPFNFLPEHTWATDLTYARAGSTISLNVMGVGALYQELDALFIQSLSSVLRLNVQRFRMDDPRAKKIGTGYATADINVLHRFTSRIEGIVRVQNVADHYRNDQRADFTTLGRQTKAGVRLNW
jgi:outer membrane receptor for ferrienterochelin and colicin